MGFCGFQLKSEVTKRISTYLKNCNSNPTIKQVQSAIKRGNKSTGWSSDNILNIIENELKYSIILGATPSQSKVETI